MASDLTLVLLTYIVCFRESMRETKKGLWILQSMSKCSCGKVPLPHSNLMDELGMTFTYMCMCTNLLRVLLPFQ